MTFDEYIKDRWNENDRNLVSFERIIDYVEYLEDRISWLERRLDGNRENE